MQALVGAVEDVVHRLLGEVAQRGFQGAAIFLADGGDLPENHGVLVFAQGGYSAVVDGYGVVGYDFCAVDEVDLAQALAFGACAQGGVEREVVGCWLAVGQTADGVHQRLRVVPGLLRVEVVDHHLLPALAEGFLYRLEEPLGVVALHLELVDHQLDGVVGVALELHAVGELANIAVDAHMEEAFLYQLLEKLLVVPLAVMHKRGEEIHFPAGILLLYQVDDAGGGVFHHRLARDVAACLAYAREEQAQEVVDLRCGAYGASWVTVDGFLLDGDYRRQSFDLVNVRALH